MHKFVVWVKETAMYQKILSSTAMLALSCAFFSCGDVSPAQHGVLQQNQERSGSLRFSAAPADKANSDVAFVEYRVSACGSANQVLASAIVPLSPGMVLPGGFKNFEDNPLDHDSAHRFADFFHLFREGCYNVVAIPLSEGQNPSKKCLSARKEGLIVKEGFTTETMLIIQCESPDPGAIDVAAVLNHEPKITDVKFKKRGKDGLEAGSKFACGFHNIVCVTTEDPDNDPLRFGFELSVNGDAESCSIEPENPEMNSGLERCFKFTCDDQGRVDIKVTVHDLLRVADKNLITFEDYFKAQGDPKPSRAEFDFMSYLGGDEACEEPCEVKPKPKPGCRNKKCDYDSTCTSGN